MKAALLTRRPDSAQPLLPYVISTVKIPAYWDSIEPFIARSVEHSNGQVTCEQIRDMLETAQATAFLTMRGQKIIAVLVVRLAYYASYTSARIIACAGSELKAAHKFIDCIEAWALTQGAVELEGWCRPAMIRLTQRMGWTVKTTIVARDLRRKLQ